MMDAFLKRVIAIRDHEQFVDGAEWAGQPDEERLKLLDKLVKVSCRLCGERIRTQDESETLQTVCSKCGGRRKQAQLERQDAEQQQRQTHRLGLLALAGFTEGEPMAEEKLCASCGKKLRSDNTKGICSACQQGGVKPTEPRPSVSSANGDDPVKRFRLVAKALGVDGDSVLSEFCEAWLEKVRNAAVPPKDELS